MLIETTNHYPVINQERWYQTEAVQSIFNYFNNGGKGNPLIALPTGSGKTHVITNFIKIVLHMWRNQRFLVITHVKELIGQNINNFLKAWPYAAIGIHSEAFKRRDTEHAVIFGGIQSMAKNAASFGFRDIIFVDEAHMIGPGEEALYQKFFAVIRLINPNVKIIGLTATPFRSRIGLITDYHEGQIFTDLIYNLCTVEGYARLIAEGYLAKLIPKRPSFEIDISDVGLDKFGDFNKKQLQNAANRERITYAALTESCRFGHDRRSWLAFAAGIEHADNIANMLNSFGIKSAVVHTRVDPKDRDRRIEEHKSGELLCLVGNNILTTGYDNPMIDFIIDLQPTMSVSKHVQKYGRGMRPCAWTYKEYCLILDYGGNVRRNGPINDPYIPGRKNKEEGDAPVKICDHCGTYNHAAARFCEDCGEPFEFKTKIVRKANEEEILKSDLPITEIFDVERVFYYKHISKQTGIPALVCSYWVSGLSKYDEWVNLENNKAKHFAHEWWRQRHAMEPPATVDEALNHIAQLRVPRQIAVWTNKKHPQIVRVMF